MWPYLLQRRRELSIAKVTYRDSFLGKAIGEWFTLKEYLWASPDNHKQATVAIR
jgi:hypothetical protein